MDINEFPPAVIRHLGWYVYRLIDPRDGSTFYVGKGKGNRVFAHMRGEVAVSDNDELLSNKLRRLREIRLAGLEVIHVIHRHGMADEEAEAVQRVRFGFRGRTAPADLTELYLGKQIPDGLRERGAASPVKYSPGFDSSAELESTPPLL